jgi:hypothetical protein
MPETYQFEQLDRETRDYLLLVRDRDGKGAPGVYCPRSNYLPLVGLFGGFAFVIATLLITFPPTDQPTKEALLQTAGCVPGIWMIFAALRVWLAGKSGKYAGHFAYADPETLYEASGSSVRVTDLGDLREAKAVQNFNEGNYQDTSITLKLGKGDRTKFEVKDEERGRRMTVYLNAVAYMRDGGEDGNDRYLKSLSPEQMGAMAKEVAKTGQFPKSAPEEGNDVGRIPHPRKEGRASTGLLGILFWGLIGVGIFFGFRAINGPYRDQIVFDRITQLPPKDRPPALRLYLANPDFKSNRDKAQDMLNQFYENGARANIKGKDDELKAAMSDLILSLKTREPVVSLIAAEERPAGKDDPAAGMRETALRNSLADKFGATIGDELVVFAAPTKEGSNAVDTGLKGMIDIRWKFTGPGAVEYTIQFRKTPDDEPYVSKTVRVALRGGDANVFAEVLSEHIAMGTIGVPKKRPVFVPQDF